MAKQFNMCSIVLSYSSNSWKSEDPSIRPFDFFAMISASWMFRMDVISIFRRFFGSFSNVTLETIFDVNQDPLLFMLYVIPYHIFRPYCQFPNIQFSLHKYEYLKPYW